MPLIAASSLPPALLPGELAGVGVLPAGPGFAFPGGPMIPRALLGGVLPPGLVGWYALPAAASVPPSPTGWKSTAVRRGPDPRFTTATRRAGLG